MLDHSAVTAQLSEFTRRESLPPAFVEVARQWYWPLCTEVAEWVREGKLKVLGISGTQGSGKSTLASLLRYLLKHNEQVKVAVLSLDDFYFTRAQPQNLANTIHPLLITRGVPGTHDFELAIKTIQQLLNDDNVCVPRFDKANDDRSDWECMQAPVDLVIVEGWCLGFSPQTQTQLQTPINKLEREQDPDGSWRQFSNNALQEYQKLFKLIDTLIYLRSPNFDAVRRWRGRQEQKLAQSLKAGSNNRIMDEHALEIFLQHYQRLTEHGFKTLPAIADIVFSLNEQQQITQRINRCQHA
jgi:D-glycerate 3-kinase